MTAQEWANFFLGALRDNPWYGSFSIQGEKWKMGYGHLVAVRDCLCPTLCGVITKSNRYPGYELAVSRHREVEQ